MLKSLTIRTTLTASALAAIAGLAIVSQSGAASAREILSCEGTSRQSVVECCEREVLKKGQPMWMRQTGANCRSLPVKCSPNSTISSVNQQCVAVYERPNGGRGRDAGKR